MSQQKFKPENVPELLKAQNRWVGWKYQPRSEGRAKRVFVGIRSQKPVRINQSREFATFDEALKALEGGGLEGLAFATDGTMAVVSGMVYQGPTQKSRIRKLDTYTENASSRHEGVCVIGLADLPKGQWKRDWSSCRWTLTTEAHFVPITGDRLPDAPAEVLKRHTEFAKLYRHHVGRLPKYDSERTVLPEVPVDPPVEQPSSPPQTPSQQTLALADLNTEVAARARVKMSPETVQQYVETMQDGGDLGRVVVFKDTDGTLRLADGLHRVEAAKKQGKTEILAEVREGDERAAILYAAGANLRHGLRPTTEDRKQVATLLLKDQEWGSWSDREIGRRCGLTNKTVGKLRKGLSEESPQMASGSTEEAPQKRKVTRNGAEYEMDTSTIGKAGQQVRAGAGIQNESGDAPAQEPTTNPPSPEIPAAQDQTTVGESSQSPPASSADIPKSATPRDWARDNFDLGYLVESGLIFQINNQVLHPLGLGFVVTEKDGQKVLSLKDSRADPAKIERNPLAKARGRERLARFMAEFGQAQLDRPKNVRPERV